MSASRGPPVARSSVSTNIFPPQFKTRLCQSHSQEAVPQTTADVSAQQERCTYQHCSCTRVKPSEGKQFTNLPLHAGHTIQTITRPHNFRHYAASSSCSDSNLYDIGQLVFCASRSQHCASHTVCSSAFFFCVAIVHHSAHHNTQDCTAISDEFLCTTGNNKFCRRHHWCY